MSDTSAGRKPDLICVEENPYNAETPLAQLTQIPTPTSFFYARNHFDVPNVDVQAFRLIVEGAVDHPRGFALPELKSFCDHAECVATFECAGNGRTVLNPRVPGTPWNWGAVSTARFGGIRLRDLLNKLGLGGDAREVLFVGADRGEVEPGRIEKFERSLPLDECLKPDVLLAWKMNGEPLTVAHGAPLRLVVPAWYAVASVKWLTHIRALREPFLGFYQHERYVYQQDPYAVEGEPVAKMRIRSLISEPAAGAKLKTDPIDIRGIAWSGEAPVQRVDFSTDGGKTWHVTELERSAALGVAQKWHFRWTPPNTGRFELVARATDANGHCQALAPVWNTLGYGNNCVHRVAVEVL